MVSGYVKDGKMSINAMYNELAFKKKNSRIDWRKIAAVDLDRVARDMDVYTLQDNIDHITFCNIDAEIDTRLMDPNYVKLFKISQFIIEYLIHSQNYLTDVIGSVESQLNGISLEKDELKKTNEKLQKDLTETKKENKRRKKMIETQQTLMSVTSSNYHQCLVCSKVFLNISYLQAHMGRRHPEYNSTPQNPKITEMEKELKEIKERLRITENELLAERNARLGGQPAQPTPPPPSAELIVILQKQVEEKNNEIKRVKDEFRKNKITLNKEIHEVSEKNLKLEKSIKDLEERLGKQSNVGWIKDDIDLEKDTAIKLKKENEILNETITNLKNQLEELKSKYKAREAAVKAKYIKEIEEKNEEISNLRARLAEFQNSIGKNEKQLAARIEELLIELQEERQQKMALEQQLADSAPKQPPKVPPRKTPETPRSPSPRRPPPGDLIYLPDYCPLTLKAVQANPNHLDRYRKEAEKLLEQYLNDVGIDKNVKGLSANDYKLKMKEVREIQNDLADEIPGFRDLRKVFAELCDKHAAQKLNPNSGARNRVTFKKDTTSSHREFNQITPRSQQRNLNSSVTLQSEETDDDVSLSRALESVDDLTEATNRSQPHDQNRAGVNTAVRSTTRSDLVSPRKTLKVTGNMIPDDNSDLESISQLLSDRSASRKKATGRSNVNDTKRKLEKQFEMNAKRTHKPAPNAVPIGFQTDSRNKSQDSFSSISDVENELNKGPRPKSGVRSSLQDSQSSSVWVSDSHSNDVNHQIPSNNVHNQERPATANSSKTLNFDSDDIENLE